MSASALFGNSAAYRNGRGADGGTDRPGGTGGPEVNGASSPGTEMLTGREIFGERRFSNPRPARGKSQASSVLPGHDTGTVKTLLRKRLKLVAECHTKVYGIPYESRQVVLKSPSMELQPIISDFTLKDRVYGRLRDAISGMNIYQAGTDLRLDERSVAEQLNVSRTPLREALSRLENEGLVEIRARKGVFIVRKTLEEILEMIVAWAALESMAARLATEVASDQDIRALRKHALKHSESSAHADLSEYSDANIKFHQMILDMSGCRLLAEIADGLFVHMHAVRRRALEENDRATRSVVDHAGIIDALEARDGDLAAKLVRIHTMRLHSHVRRVWSKFEGRPASKAG